jgi:hypothetical protein
MLELLGPLVAQALRHQAAPVAQPNLWETLQVAQVAAAEVWGQMAAQVQQVRQQVPLLKRVRLEEQGVTTRSA